MKEKVQTLFLDDDRKTNNKECTTNGDEGYFNTYSHFAIHHEMLSVNCFQSIPKSLFIIRFFIGQSQNRKLSRCNVNEFA